MSSNTSFQQTTEVKKRKAEDFVDSKRTIKYIKMRSPPSPWKLPAKRVTTEDRALALTGIGAFFGPWNIARVDPRKVTFSDIRLLAAFSTAKVSQYPTNFYRRLMGNGWEKEVLKFVSKYISLTPTQLECEYRRCMERRVKTERLKILRNPANPNGVNKIVPTVILSGRHLGLPGNVVMRILKHVVDDLGA